MPRLHLPILVTQVAKASAPDSITALKRGFQILRCFQPGDDVLGNKELSERTQLPRSTVARLTGTLLEMGYLAKDRSHRYRLASAVLDLGFTFLANFDIRGLIRPHLQEVADFAMAGCSIGMLDGMNMLYLEHARSRAVSMGINVGIGSRAPVVSTAMGHAYLAGLAPAERAGLMKMLEVAHQKEWPRQRRLIEKSIRDIKDQGFCFISSTWNPGVNAVGVPLRSKDGRHVYSITCAGPSSLLSETKLREVVGPKLVEVVQSASTMLM